MLKIAVGIILAFVGHIVYIASLETIKDKFADTGKREAKFVWLMILGLILAAIGGVFIGMGL